MKIKKTLGVLMSVAMLFSTVPANAYTNSCSGNWGNSNSVTYNYCSDGTLFIEGDGTEFLTSGYDDVVNSGDIKNLYIKNIDEIERRDGLTYLLPSGLADSIEYCYLDAGTMSYILGNDYNSSLKEVVFGNNVTTLGSYVLAATEGIRITMPSTITSINDDWINIRHDEVDITIVCEYGSEAYQWAFQKQKGGYYKNINIELIDVVAKSAVKLDNTQSYQVVVPETIELTKTESGWGCETYLGVVGEIDNYITIKTSKSFNIVGEDTPSTERVLVSTEDENLVDHDSLVVVKIEKDDLSNATDSIELNGNSEQGYKVEYDCKLENQRVMKQVYSGSMEFIITE